MIAWFRRIAVWVLIAVGCSVAGGVLERDASPGAAVRHGLLGVLAAMARRRIRINVDIGGENGGKS